MAVGAINSQSQNAAKPVVIRAGEVQASTVEALKDPKAKVYHHMMPGAQFIMPNGLALKFLGGQLVTNDPEVIEELDKVANKPSSHIFTQNVAVIAAQELQKRAADDAADTAGTIKD